MNLHISMTLSSFFTLVRLVVSPLLMPPLLVYVLPYHNSTFNILLAFLFMIFAITDFLDGYCARRYHQETAWGKSFDPLADKCLIASSLIALMAVGKICFFWVILFVVRDFFMMGLRAYVLECGASFSVSYGAKLKTSLQMILITLLIADPLRYISSRLAFFYMIGETFLLYGTLFLTYATMIDYCYRYKYSQER